VARAGQVNGSRLGRDPPPPKIVAPPLRGPLGNCFGQFLDVAE